MTNGFEVVGVFGSGKALVGRFNGIAVHIAVGQFDDVIATVAVFRPAGIVRGQAFAARLYRQRQIVNLRTGIVVIKFAGYIPAGGIEQTAYTIANGSTTAVTDMQRSGRVGRHKFHLHFAPGAIVVAAVGFFLFQHGFYQTGGRGIAQIEVNKTRAGNFDFFYQRVGRQGIHQQLRQFARIFTGRLGQHHRQVSGQIAVGFVAGVVDLDARFEISGKGSLGLKRGDGSGQKLSNLRFHRGNLA